MSELSGDLASLRIDRERPSRGGGRGWLLLAAVVLTALAALGVGWARQGFGALAVETVHPTVVSTQQASAGTPILTASGYVVARRKAVVSAKIQGRLSELRVEEGSRIRKGDVIARLDSADVAAQVERARAQVQRAEADLAENNRQLRLAQGLAGDKILSQDQLDAAQSRAALATAALRQARADLALAEALEQNTVIRAPFTGVVVRKMAEVGESVAPIPPGVNISTASGAIVALADLDTLEVEADVSESNVAKLKPEQPAEVTVEAFPDRHYRAVLRQIIPTADRTKATVQVKVTILDKDQDLKPEMSAKVTFEETAAPASAAKVSAKPLLTVPKDAVISRDGRSVVFEIREGKARLRPLVVGGERQGQLVVSEGLSGGETLIAHPPESLRDGDGVRPKS